MSVHLHHSRQWTAWILTAVALSPFALVFGAPVEENHLSPITGCVTFSGRPVQDMTICLDTDGEHAAYGSLQADGTFRLTSMIWIGEGAMTGHYRAHLLYTHRGRPELPAKYRDPATSGIEVDVATGWNDFRIDLH
jgi:hypothetical protein